MSSAKKKKEESLPYFDKGDAVTVAVLILAMILIFIRIEKQKGVKELPAKEQDSGWQQPSPGDTTAQKIMTSPPFR